jgi:hypothetical protein
MREVAKHLAAMGRHGDATLVHMSPQEMSALHGIAAINGTHITHNPHTGLPEAFNLGGFFKSLLPTIAGAVAAPLTGGSSLAAVLAGATTGAALNSGNPLMGALMGGLGGFGGAGIGNAIQGTGAAAAVPAGAANTGTGITESAANAATSGGGSAGFKLPSATASLPNPSGSVGLSSLPDSSIGFKAPQLSQSVSNTGSAINPIGSAGVGGGTLPTLGDIGVGGGAATQPGMSGLDKFVQRLGGTGPNADLIAAGKAGMPLAMAGLAGIEPPKMEEDKYDPYAKLNLGGDSGLRFFAEGGDVNEMPDPGSDPFQDAQEARSYGIGGLSYAEGGDVQKFGSYHDMVQYLKNNQGMFAGQAPGGKPGLFGGPSLNLDAPVAVEPNRFGFINGFPNSASMGGFPNNYFALANPSIAKLFNYNMSGRAAQPVQAPPRPPGPFGLDSGVRFAKGGYLDGPGDGMSDSIPATIAGKQPARLADGEFVVPADVVSHLGNGSTKAGAQRLYSMMDKVRHARTGTTKQGRQINPKKYLPA